MPISAVFEETYSRVRMRVTGEASATWVTFLSRKAGATAWNTVRGGYQVPVSAGTSVYVLDYEFETDYPDTQSVEYRAALSTGVNLDTSVTCWITSVAWMKFPGFPYLNRQLTIVDFTLPSRESRGDVLSVINAATGVAVQEFMSGQRGSITVRLDGNDASTFDSALAIGSVIFLHLDEAQLDYFPTMYAVVKSVARVRPKKSKAFHCYFRIDLEEVTKPGYAYTGSIGSWQTVINTYPTWTALLAAQATWSSTLEIVGGAGDVIVG